MSDNELRSAVYLVAVFALFMLGFVLILTRYNNNTCIPYRNDAQQYNQYGRN